MESERMVDLVAIFDAAYGPEWDRVAEQYDAASQNGSADYAGTAAGINAVAATLRRTVAEQAVEIERMREAIRKEATRCEYNGGCCFDDLLVLAGGRDE